METLEGFISRPGYIEQIRPYIGSPVIKVLTGQRRAGKSYMLYQLMDEIKKKERGANIISINTEFAEFRHILRDTDLYDLVNSRLQPGGNYVFIDEIQEIRSFETALKSLFAEGRCDLYCTGSNAHLLSGELATYLAGRYIQFHIHPLGYGEFLTFHGLENTRPALEKYLRIGGLPYLASLPPEENLAFEYLKNVYESILLRDVVVRENIRNVRFLESLAAYLADNTGNLFSANTISKYLKNQRIAMPVQTVINYLEALVKSMLIHRASRKEVRGLKIFEIGEKYYFEDLGLRNILCPNPLPRDISKLMENAIYLFLVQRGYTVYVGRDGDREIDFIAEGQNGRIYVQAAYHVGDREVYAREFGNLEAVGDNYPKYVVTMDESVPEGTHRGIRLSHLRNFLLMRL